MSGWNDNRYRVGIDPGLRNIAAFVLSPDGLYIDWIILNCTRSSRKAPYRIHRHSFRYNKECLDILLPEDSFTRAYKIIKELINYLNEIKCDKAYCIEDYAYSAGRSRKNQGASASIITLGEVGGILKTFITQQEEEFDTRATQTLRKLFTGRGDSSINTVIEVAKAHITPYVSYIKDPFTPNYNAEHISIAYAAAFYLHWMGFEKTLLNYKKDTDPELGF